MQLEDHLGEVVRKARDAAKVSVEAAAGAAGVSAEVLDAMERTGKGPAGLKLEPLAKLVGLSPSKLERLASGWLPPAVDLSVWRELRQIRSGKDGNTAAAGDPNVGLAGRTPVNCYLVWDEVSREAALFDTGWEAEPVLETIAENELILRHLFLTHMDEDHVAAMGRFREQFPKLHLHTNSRNAPPQHRNRANDFIHLGSLRITNRDTPGHTEESVSYVIGNWPEDAPHVAIIGDTIFAGSLARGKQSIDLLKQKVREQLFTLPGETLLCPGHGPVTTVALEKENNPIF